MKKNIIIIALFLSAYFAGAAYAGEFVWDDKGAKYQNDDGTWKTGWLQEEDGSWYFFDANGYAVTKWYRENGRRYYFRENNGKLITDRITMVDGQVYQFDHEGVSTHLSGRYSGWMLDDVNWYYRLPDGSYIKNAWKQIDGVWYHFDEEGYMQTGPITIDGIFYYLDENGAMAKNDARVVEGITYTFDDSGAGTVSWMYKAPLFIPPEEEKTDFQKAVDAMADSILAGIVTENMGQRQKAEAIYRWVKGNLRYNGYSPVGDWVGGAYDGMKKRHGDCYTYYATSAELLSRAGMQTIEVIRSTDQNHYWNLVNIDGQWYHFDPCPRRSGGDFCLLTDAQIAGSRSHIFDHSLYPPTP